jgi:hypothetical protein
VVKAEVLQIGEYHQQVEITLVMVAETAVIVQRNRLGTVILEMVALEDIQETAAKVDYRLTTKLLLLKELTAQAAAAVADQEEDQSQAVVGAAAKAAVSVYMAKA